MSDAHCMQYLIPMNFDGDVPRTICRPLEGETVIHLAQVEAGVRFPFCERIEELCRYYDIAHT